MGVCQFPPSVGFTHPTSSRVLPPPRPTNTLTLILSPLPTHPHSGIHVCFVPSFSPLNSQPSSLVNTYLFHTIILTEKTPKERKEKQKKTQGKKGRVENQLGHPPFFLSLVQSTDRSQTPKTQLVPKMEPGMGKEPIKLTKLGAVRGRSTPAHPPTPSLLSSPHLVGPLQPGLLGSGCQEALYQPSPLPWKLR